MKKKYSAILIGAGRIASQLDGPKSTHILTHAHAISLNSRIELSGIVDTNHETGSREAKKWKTDFYTSTTSALATDPDVVIIATPDNSHTEILNQVSRTSVRLIICEKPIAENKKQLQSIAKNKLLTNIPLLINFSRRFDPTVIQVRNALRAGKYGRVLSANAIYTNGVLHNGTHMLDLARFFFGEIISIKGLFATEDHTLLEPSISGIATFEHCPQFSLMIGDEREYSVFELEILTQKKRLRFVNFGFEIMTQSVVPDPLYKGFRALSAPKTIKTGLSSAMVNLYSHATDVLDGKEAPSTTLSDGIKTQKACFKLLDSLR